MSDDQDTVASPPAEPPAALPEIDDIGWDKAPYTVFSGFCMGTADVVPGVSGGTMAVALGIYHQLLAAITSANRKAVAALLGLKLRELFRVLHWRFLMCLLGGLALGIGLMVKVVKLPQMVLPESPYVSYVYAIFFGMVLTSTVTLGRHLERWTALRGGMVVVGTAVGFGVVNLVPRTTPDHALFVYLCGAVAICAMLLPGISGSFILLILGKYAYVLGALAKLQLAVIVPFALGCLTGLVAFSRLLKWLLDRWHDTTLALLIGFLLGSLWRIWPYQTATKTEIVREKLRVLATEPHLPATLDVKVVLCFVLGVAFVVAIEIYASRRKAADGATASQA